MKSHAKMLLTTSFAVQSIAGVSFIGSHWSGSNPSIAISRSALFVLIAAILHAAGFALYARQSRLIMSSDSAMTRATAPPHPEFLRVVLLQQVPSLFLTALLLDGGRAFRTCCIVAIAHWSLIAIILLRRRSLRQIDVFLIRWGFFPLTILTGFLASLVTE